MWQSKGLNTDLFGSWVDFQSLTAFYHLFYEIAALLTTLSLKKFDIEVYISNQVCIGLWDKRFDSRQVYL